MIKLPTSIWALVGMTPLIGFFGLLFLSLFIHKYGEPAAFFNKYNKAYSLEQLKIISLETNVVVRDFSNGEWVALIYEHDCCTGNGFTANIFVDSRGNRLTNFTHNYCNTKATDEEISNVASVDLDQFYRRIGIDLVQ